MEYEVHAMRAVNHFGQLFHLITIIMSVYVTNIGLFAYLMTYNWPCPVTFAHEEDKHSNFTIIEPQCQATCHQACSPRAKIQISLRFRAF